MDLSRNQFWLASLGIAGVAIYVYQRQQSQLAANDPAAAQGADSGAGVVQNAINFLDVQASNVVNLITSRGYRNNNPGNLRFIVSNPFNGQVSNDNGYGVYDTPQNGTRALGHNLDGYARRGLVTTRQIISTWAPPSENNVPAYVGAVASELSVDPDEQMDVHSRLPDLARAIARHENGYVDSGYDWQWVYL